MNKDTGIKVVGSGLSFLEALLLAFIILKLCGVINWSWIWVISPIWIPLVLILVAVVIVAIVVLIESIVERKKKE